LAPDFSGEWQAPDYKINIVKNGNKIEGRGEFEKTSSNALSSAWVGLPAITENITMEVKYSGDLIGHGIKYKLWIHKKGYIPTLLGDIPDEGLMIISDNLSEIKVYKKGTKTSEEFYSLNKIY